MKKFFTVLFLSGFIFLTAAGTAWADSGYYISAGGESICKVADLLGVDHKLLSLINDLDENQLLPAGKLLRLPQSPCLKITVASGDTLDSLAKGYDISVDRLASCNGLRLSDRLYPGQQLLVPLDDEEAVCAFEPVEEPERAVHTAFMLDDYLWPAIGAISSPYGERWGTFHWGLDIAVDEGTPVLAAASGWVEEAGWKNDAYGYAVMLDHSNGRETLYGHASKVAVQPGEWVEAGQVIAYSGSTGNSTGPHVHFEIRLDGSCVDPLQYLPE